MISSEFDRDVHTNKTVVPGLAWPVLGEVQVLTVLTTGSVKDGTFSFETTERLVPASAATSESVPPLVPLEEHESAIESKVERYRDMVSAYKSRIRVLKEQAELDGYTLNQRSKAAFLEFIDKNPLIKRGRLVLTENGNLRAVWKGKNGAHVGLQFLDGRSIQYVIFKQRETSSPVSRAYGRDTMRGISKQIETFDLDDVLYT